MEKTDLKKPYKNAETEIVNISTSDVIQTSNQTADGTNVPGNGWTSDEW